MKKTELYSSANTIEINNLRIIAGDIIVIGNGPLNKDYSDIVDRAGYVVRINYCPSHNSGCGRKTDLLALTNSGNYLKKMLDFYGTTANSQLDLTPNILLVRNHLFYVFYRNFLRIKKNADSRCFEVIPQKYFQISKSHTARIYRIGIFLSVRLNGKLKHENNKQFLMPSTGMLTVEYVLSKLEWQKGRVKIIGFSHEGWEHHPFDAEKSLISKYEKEGYLERI